MIFQVLSLKHNSISIHGTVLLPAAAILSIIFQKSRAMAMSIYPYTFKSVIFESAKSKLSFLKISQSVESGWSQIPIACNFLEAQKWHFRKCNFWTLRLMVCNLQNMLWLCMKTSIKPIGKFLAILPIFLKPLMSGKVESSSLRTNSSMFANCLVFCDVRDVQSLILDQNVMFGKFNVGTINVQCVRSSVFWCSFQD